MEPNAANIRIGHSPDPDDAFMFYALTEGLIDTKDRSYEHCLVDIDTLNQDAKNGKYEVSAVSIHSFPSISDSYSLMNCGASMGEGYGPMIIASSPLDLEDVRSMTIAIPGVSTSAYLALRLALGEVKFMEVPFDDILPGVRSGEFEAGVIIHEGQLTWEKEGCHLVLDLGKWWNEETGLPLPLGGNVVRNDLGAAACQEIADDVRRSIEHALEQPEMALEFAIKWGRGIDTETNEEFVRMYVNQRTVDYGEEGRDAVRLFLKKGQSIGLIREDFEVDSMTFIGE